MVKMVNIKQIQFKEVREIWWGLHKSKLDKLQVPNKMEYGVLETYKKFWPILSNQETI